MPLPRVTITDLDRERLISAAVEGFSNERASSSASTLLSEIGRANVVSSGSVSPDVVIMHREIEIRDNIHKIKRRLRLVYPGEDEDLVYPGEGDVAPEAVSVLTPLGVALIGLSKGDSIEWCTRTGDRRNVTILRTFPHLGRDSEGRNASMNEMYPDPSGEIARKRRELAPAQEIAFEAFGKAVFAEGRLSAKAKQIIAVAVAHVTQCPYCIRGHTKAALRAGATQEELMEAIWIAAEMRAGGSYAHAALMINESASQGSAPPDPTL